LIKAQVEDEHDDAGDGKRVRKILAKADSSNAYADMLGLAKMNENIFSPDLPPHDKETGEIIEQHSSVATPATGEQTGASQTPAAPVALSNPQPNSSREADKAGDAPPPASPAVPDFVPAFLVPAEARQKVKLRPNCLRPDTCAGQGARHCHSCEKAAAQSEAA
jgi:hypothetical protein